MAPTRNHALVGQGFFVAVRTRLDGDIVVTGISGTPSGRALSEVCLYVDQFHLAMFPA